MVLSTAPIAEASPARRAADAPDLAKVREAQAALAAQSIAQRLSCIGRMRGLLYDASGDVASHLDGVCERQAGVSLVAEVLPVLDACRFLQKRAHALLGPRPVRRGGALWMAGMRVEIRREPHGVVLIIGPSNYPFSLVAIQAVQALAAGNAVVIKPGGGGSDSLSRFASMARHAGLPAYSVTVLGDEPEEAMRAIEAGVDKVVLTGSAATGRSVLGQLAPRLTPAVMELSGCDAVFVRASADLEMAAKAVAFGISLNAGRTCIAPRRIFVDQSIAADFERRLVERLAAEPHVGIDDRVAARLADAVEQAMAGGARIATGALPRGGRMKPMVVADAARGMALLREDLFAPITTLIPVDSDEHAADAAADCLYALGSAVFGEAVGSREMAHRINAGLVTVNDLIAPLSDPRVPLAPRGESGFGVTRGEAGLLEMTRIKTVVTRRGRWRPHFDGPLPPAASRALVDAMHGRGPTARIGGLIRFVKGVREQRDDQRERGTQQGETGS